MQVPQQQIVASQELDNIAAAHTQTQDNTVTIEDEIDDSPVKPSNHQQPMHGKPRKKKLSDSEQRRDSADPQMSYALQNRLKNCPSYKTKDGTLKPYGLCSMPTKDFIQFGSGIYLYFRFLKQLTCIFFTLFILGIPLLLVSFYSAKLPPSALQFEQTTVGNLGPANETNVDMPPWLGVVPQINDQIPKAEIGPVFGILDLVGVIILFLFIQITKTRQQQIANAADDAVITAADYTVHVTGLPNSLYNREELQTFFERRWGKVADIALCYNNSDIVHKYIQKSSIVNDMKRAQKIEDAAKYEKLEKKMSKLNTKIFQLKKRFSQRCVCAYVTFEEATTADKVLYDYPNKWYTKMFQPKKLRFRRKHALIVKKAPEPSEIIYENMKYSSINKKMRRYFTFLLAICAILVSCALVLAAAIYRQQNRELSAQTNENCVRYENIDDIDATTLQDEADIDCYCSQISIQDIANDSTKRSLCSDYLQAQGVATALTILSSMVIVIVNMTLKFFSRALVYFEKHTSITRMESELTWKMFAGLFFNTGIIILVVNANTSNYFGFTVLEGQFDDFIPQWYSIVGTALLLTMIINVVNPHLIPVVSHPIMMCLKKRASKKCVTQRELNKLWEGEEFTLAERYAVIANTFCVAFLYSGGMPILLFIGSITFAVNYLCDKFTLLRVCKTPPKYNIDIAQFTLTLIRPAIYLHLVISCWVLGSPTVFNSKPLNNAEISDLASQAQAAGEGVGENDNNFTYADYFIRILNWNTFPLFAMFALIAGYDIIDAILTMLKLKNIIKAIALKLVYILCCGCALCPAFCKNALFASSSTRANRKIAAVLNAENYQDAVEPPYYDCIRSGMRFESYQPTAQRMYKEAYMQGTGLLKVEPLFQKNNRFVGGFEFV